MKVVINRCFGGFGLSHKAVMEYAKLKGIELFPFMDCDECNFNNKFKPYTDGDDAFLIYYSTKPLDKNGSPEDNCWFRPHDIERNDENLIKIVETMGEDSFGRHAGLEVVEIPDDVDYEIDEYDGSESIHEKHRSW